MPVLVIDVRPGATEKLLSQACGEPVIYRLEFPERGETLPAFLAIGVFLPTDSGRATKLAAWSQPAMMPVLGVAVDSRTALIGPLTIPARVGCGHCAQARIQAAAAARIRRSDTITDEGGDGDLITFVRACVTSEVERFQAHGPQASRVIDHVLSVDRELTVVRHRFVPLSRCPVCGGAIRLTEPRSHLSSLEDPMDADSPLAGWVDPLTGVIPTLYLDQPTDERSSLPFVVSTAPPHILDDGGVVRRLPLGWGKGLTLIDAARSAIGEAIERYSASIPDPTRLVWKRVGDLDGDYLDPKLFPLYTHEQYALDDFPYVRFDRKICHPWVRGRWLGSGTDVWVPAVFAFLSFSLRPENLICQGTSNGLAASTEWHDAALRATLELVERDAFMAAWLTGASGRRVATDDIEDAELRAVLDAIEALGGCIELYLLPTSAFGTSAVCLALGDGRVWPGVSIGLGCDLDPVAALRQAILELAQTGPHLSRLLQSGTLQVPDDPASVRDMLDHAAFYFPSERATAFDRLRAESKTASVSFDASAGSEGKRSLADCALALADAGVRVALVDVTSADVATSPFSVVRAVSPDLQPISYGYGLERTPVRRIRDRVLLEGPPIHPIW